MLSRRSLFAVVCVLIFLLATAALSVPRLALGQMTIPTRTPVPDGGSTPEPQPTDDNSGGGNKPNPTTEPQPTDESQPTPSPEPSLPPATTVVNPTNTPVAVETAAPTGIMLTATPSATIPPATETATPTATVGFFEIGDKSVDFPANNRPFPQASLCGMPPTFTSTGATSIYTGPGDAYHLVGLIGETEVRPIVGRAAFTNWWVIQLDATGRAGWVTDESGAFHGYTGLVPIISAPDLNGIVPTPGSNPWVPTPVANCGAAELLAGVAFDEADGNGVVAPPSGLPDGPEKLTQISQERDGKSPLIQTVGETGAPDEDNTNSNTVADPLLHELADSATPLELPGTASSQLPNLLPVAGIVLILAAVIIGVFASRNRSGMSK